MALNNFSTLVKNIVPSCCLQAREKLWMALGEAAPVLVPVSQVMMCMNCTSDFSLTLRRHHCNACGKVGQDFRESFEFGFDAAYWFLSFSS